MLTQTDLPFAAKDSLAVLRELPEFFEAGQPQVHRSDLAPQVHHGRLWRGSILAGKSTQIVV